jgi:hypothetical protein
MAKKINNKVENLLEKESTSKSLEESISFIEEYCLKFSIEVIFTNKKEDQFSYATNRIFIKTNKTRKKQYLTLLHELGHFLCLKNKNYITASEKTKSYSSLTYRVAKVEEEFDAWKMGENFAKKNNLLLDKEFDMIKANSISTYMLWANNRKHPHPSYSRGKKNSVNKNVDVSNQVNFSNSDRASSENNSNQSSNS